MIRREIRLPDSEPIWLLVSQVDHARASGEIARHWREQFTSDVVDAIGHHDDGWATWESAPRLNPSNGAPYSFLELPLSESFTIWDRSISAAREFGPLAGYIVASHFYSLAGESEHADEPLTIAWLTAKRKLRTAWLDEWVRDAPNHTIDYAKSAQQMLQLTDLFSLWLCCESPITGESETIIEQSMLKIRAASLLKQYQLSQVGFGRRHPTPDNPDEALAWIIVVDPYPFADPTLSLRVPSRVVPVGTYANWQELIAASRLVELRWRLIPPGELQNPHL